MKISLPTFLSISNATPVSIYLKNYKVATVDVGATPCSMHIPLNQFLSMLLTCFNNKHDMADECLALGYIQSPGDMLEIIDPVLTVLTVLAQIKVTFS